MSNDYYGEEGCCLTCEQETKEENAIEDEEKDCLCFECKCRSCSEYEQDHEGGGSCLKAIEKAEESKADWIADHCCEHTEPNLEEIQQTDLQCELSNLVCYQPYNWKHCRSYFLFHIKSYDFSNNIWKLKEVTSRVE